jgi:hypothetical protein
MATASNARAVRQQATHAPPGNYATTQLYKAGHTRREATARQGGQATARQGRH